MTISLMQRLQIAGILTGLLLLLCMQATAQQQSMDCTKTPKDHVQLGAGDVNGANHLDVMRKVPEGAALDLQVCDADLTIKGGKDDQIRIVVDFEQGNAKLLPGDYLQALDITPQTATVHLYLPKQPRAKVILVVPPSTRNLQLNLVRGDLSFETDRISGQRKINVVTGHVDMLANADAYGSFNVSVVMGSFHDKRPGGESAHGMISKVLSGTGKGSIELNIVRGSLDVRAWD